MTNLSRAKEYIYSLPSRQGFFFAIIASVGLAWDFIRRTIVAVTNIEIPLSELNSAPFIFAIVLMLGLRYTNYVILVLYSGELLAALMWTSMWLRFIPLSDVLANPYGDAEIFLTNQIILGLFARLPTCFALLLTVLSKDGRKYFSTIPWPRNLQDLTN